jgi:hypothetical protein
VKKLWGDQVSVCYADHESAYSEMLSEVLTILSLSQDLIAGYGDCACSILLQY